MRRIFMIVGLMALLVSCQNEAGYSIHGTVDDVPDGTKIYVSQLDDNNQPAPVDTTEVKNGKFELDLPENKNPTVSFLDVEGVRGKVLYISDDNPVSFKIYKDSLYASSIEGGQDNELLKQHTEMMRNMQEEMMGMRSEMMEAMNAKDSVKLEQMQASQQQLFDQSQDKTKKMVEDNPNSIVSLMAFQNMMNSGTFSTSELKETYNNFSEEIKNSNMGKNIGDVLSKMSVVEVGKKAPEFTAPTPEGEKLSLNDALGKVTLIDFWASWCKPCRVENPNIVRIYNKYHEKGFNIIGVSLDRPEKKDEWMKAIKEDKLTWNQVSHLEFWQDPIAAQYGVRAIPAAFLLDEDGVIVATNLRGDDLEAKVAELLGEE